MIEALLVRTRRVKAGAEDPVIGESVLQHSAVAAVVDCPSRPVLVVADREHHHCGDRECHRQRPFAPGLSAPACRLSGALKTISGMALNFLACDREQ